MQLRSSLALATLGILLPLSPLFGQAQSGTASGTARTTPAAQSPAPAGQSATPEAPKPVPPPPPFPLIDRANFTATSPTADTVNAFLKASATLRE